MSIDKLKTVFSVGAWLPKVKTFYDKINEIIDYLNSNPISNINYLIYSAFVSQSGSNPPLEVDINGTITNISLENTINGAWSYEAKGTYRYTKVGAFINKEKVDILISVNANQYTGIFIKPTVFNDYIQFKVGNATSFTNNALALNDDKLNIQRIEIRVYN